MDRAKKGTKRSLITEGCGIPVGIAVGPANRNDFKLVEETFSGMPLIPPVCEPGLKLHLCLDKGYDYNEVYALCEEFGFTTHIQARGEEAKLIKRKAGYKARRWVVERTHSWMNRFRRILTRWEKKASNYLALLHFSCAWITYKCAGIFG